MKARFALAAIAAACLSTVAAAQMGAGMEPRGMGPGMMGAPGKGPGMAGDNADCPMGKAMHRAQGMRGDRMGEHGKMGGGMMDGGMMGGGMMDGGMMGGGMMGGHGPGPEALEKLGLTDEQRGKVRDIHRDLQRKQYALMGSARDLRWQLQDNAGAAEFDESAARKSYDAMAAIHKQAFEARLDAHRRTEAVLTKEQREQLRKAMRPGPR